MYHINNSPHKQIYREGPATTTAGTLFGVVRASVLHEVR